MPARVYLYLPAEGRHYNLIWQSGARRTINDKSVIGRKRRDVPIDDKTRRAIFILRGRGADAKMRGIAGSIVNQFKTEERRCKSPAKRGFDDLYDRIVNTMPPQSERACLYSAINFRAAPRKSATDYRFNRRSRDAAISGSSWLPAASIPSIDLASRCDSTQSNHVACSSCAIG